MPRSLLARLAPLAIAVALFAAAPSSSSAHIIPGSATLSQLTQRADVVAVATIKDPRAIVEGGDPSGRRPFVVAAIVEVIRGDVAKGEVRFVPHDHGAEGYAAGEEALIFLQPIEKSRDLAGASLAGAVPWAGIDPVGDRFTLRPGSREALIGAARAYAEVADAPKGEAQRRALGQATLRSLQSSEAKVAASALRDLVVAGSQPLVTTEDVPALRALIDDASRPLSLRVGLVTELERRRLLEDRELAERWVKLLREVKPAEVATVARAAGARAHADVTAELVRLLAVPDAPAAAAAALGVPGNEAAVAPLARAVWATTSTTRRAEATLQWAALQSLGRIASPAARAELTRAAREHPDTETRRAAQTELNLLAAKDARLAGSAGTSEGAPASIDPLQGSLEEPSLLRTYWKAWALFLAAALGVIAIVLRRRGVW